MSVDTGEVTASCGATVIARSSRTIFLEGNHYFPISDIDMRYLSRTRLKTVCPWKGVASYYTVSTGDGASKNAAWIYLHPSPLARKIKNHIAFAGGVRVHPVGPPVSE